MTIHSIERAELRANMNEEQAITLILKATQKGKVAEQMPCDEKRYMERKEHDKGIVLKYYSGYLFVFAHNGKCITMYQPPEWFGKGSYYGKIKIKNKKKYFCHYVDKIEMLLRYEGDALVEHIDMSGYKEEAGKCGANQKLTENLKAAAKIVSL